MVHDNGLANMFYKIPCSVTREILVLNAYVSHWRKC